MRFNLRFPPPPREDALSGLQSSRPFSLHLSPELEEAFEQSRRSQRLAHYRSSMVLAIFLFNAFLLSDYACLPRISA
jgi:hypothetical protein